MKSFEEYKNGDWVCYINPKHEWHLMQFKAYKSEHTRDAFRLKYGNRELLVDISEIAPADDYQSLVYRENMGIKDEDSTTNIRSDTSGGFKSIHAPDVYDDYGNIYTVQD